jgi:hypothetical protein
MTCLTAAAAVVVAVVVACYTMLTAVHTWDGIQPTTAQVPVNRSRQAGERGVDLVVVFTGVSASTLC